MKKPLNIIVFGASGDLAERKIFPAFFTLYGRGYLPDNTRFFGFARSNWSHQEFRDKISGSLTCRYESEIGCGDLSRNFLSNCYYISGQYESQQSFRKLNKLFDFIDELNDGMESDYIFYFAVPSNVFADISLNLSTALEGRNAKSRTKLVIEKPFGRDRKSSDELTWILADGFSEEQIFRIDHYLGKEMVQNLLVLRFANQFFEPLWNSKYIEKMELLWTEDLGVYGRGKYFDNYGIIRDVMQNHLLQILALIGMEEPASMDADAIRDRKVELLENVKAIVPGGVQAGQYTGAVYKGVNVSGYRDEPSVPDDSLTPTFARIKFKIDNERWRDTRFVMTAGKGMRESKAEVRIKFKGKSGGIFCNLGKCPKPNELIIRIQPNEGFHFKITTKAPDSKLDFAVKDLDLSYNRAFNNPVLPEAYENLLLDVMAGNKELFIRDDELRASWDILMPVLNYLKLQKVVPEPYPFGSCGLKPVFKETDCPCEKK